MELFGWSEKAIFSLAKSIATVCEYKEMPIINIYKVPSSAESYDILIEGNDKRNQDLIEEFFFKWHNEWICLFEGLSYKISMEETN